MEWLTRGGQRVGRQLLRWTFWSPWRLGVAVMCVLLLVLVIGQVNRRIGEAGPQPTAAPSAPQDLPSGWETWPRVPGQSNGAPPPSAAPSASTSRRESEGASPSSAPASTPAPTGVGTPAHDNTDTQAAAAGAQKAATGFAREFLNTGKGDDEKKRQADWIKRLTPYLVPALVSDLETVALDNVPTGTVEEARVTSVSDFNATVQLATSAGQMTMTLEWSGSAWQVSDYLPPAEG